MLLKILGGIDIFSGLILIIVGLNIPVYGFFLIFTGIILLIKSLIGGFRDFAGWVDFVSGVVLLSLQSLEIPEFVIIILGVIVLQKGIISFL